MVLSDFADISQVIIAIANLILAGYIFIYQRGRDNRSEVFAQSLHEQNIRLQWFKELVIQPNIDGIERFYAELHTIRGQVNSDNLTLDQKQAINTFIKGQQTILRKSLIDVLLQVDKPFHDKVLSHIDELIDGLTNSIFDDELKLNMDSVADRCITSRISYSRNKLIGLLFNYKGVSN